MPTARGAPTRGLFLEAPSGCAPSSGTLPPRAWSLNPTGNAIVEAASRWNMGAGTAGGGDCADGKYYPSPTTTRAFRMDWGGQQFQTNELDPGVD